MEKSLTFLVTCCLLLSATALKLPDYIKKCSIKDPKFDACALKSAQESLPNLVTGDRKYKIPVLDPLIVEEFRIKDRNIDSAMLDTSVTGLKDISLQKVSFDFEKRKITVEVSIAVLKFTGAYTISGKLMTLPIAGSGHFNATIYDLQANYTTSYDLTKLHDGQVYLVLQDYHLTIVPQDLKVHMDNLFGGNKALGDSMNDFINENWREILREIGKPAMESLGSIFFKIFRDASNTVPYKDVFDDTE